jgi:hypothetical protein
LDEKKVFNQLIMGYNPHQMRQSRRSTMYAVEFKATIKNGTIAVPKRFRSEISETVKVIILKDHQAKRKGASSPDAIEALLARPLQVANFTPLTREECHERH